MKKSSLFFIALLYITSATAQSFLNMELVGFKNYVQNCNDVWGYVAEDGTEYAILGTVTGTAILSLADPANPEEVLFIPGANSVWRDMKNWNEHVYVTTDQGTDGLLVIDMSGAPSDISYYFWKPELEIRGLSSTLRTCHNLYIDDKGYCYLAGCNVNDGGVIILDVHTNPGIPSLVSACDPRYSHDAMVRNDTLFSSEINGGVFSVIDVTDKSNPRTLVTQRTSFTFTHNSWVSDDGRYLFTTDEKPDAYIDAYDISDLDNIRRLDRIRPLATEGTGVIPHNVHYFDGYLVISWYTDGVVVVDASQPDHLIKVGQYDTYQQAAGGFNGCWGAYPWLPSGLVLGSDINSGLYVLRPNYVRASRLSGLVKDASTGAVLADVSVNMEDAQANLRRTDLQGRYKTGIAGSGTRDIVFTKPGYKEFRTTVSLDNGRNEILDVELEPLPRTTINGNVIAKSSGLPIGGAMVSISVDGVEVFSETDENGRFVVQPSGGTLDIIVGKWGYRYKSMTLEANAQNYELEFELEEGYEDDFVFDYGWQVSGTAARGNWERGVPEATFFNNQPSNPGNAFPQASGNRCFVTGLLGGQAGDFDVDEGTAILTSPILDLSDVNTATLRYAFWFFNDGGFGNPNDTLIIRVTNGLQTREIARVTGRLNSWNVYQNISLGQLIQLNDQVQFIIETSDLANSGHLVEAAFDHFLVEYTRTTSINESEKNLASWQMFPNPTSNSVFVELSIPGNISWKLISTLGEIKNAGMLSGNSKTEEINFGQQVPGVYYLQLNAADGTSLGTRKLHIRP